MARDDRKFYQYAESVLRERIAAEEREDEMRKDIMHHLLHAEDPMTGKGFNREQLTVESSLLIAAGADTTSLTLAAAFFYLVHNPRVMDVLVEEIRAASFGEDMEHENASRLIKLPYLRAVIDETLRLSPPVPSLLPREVLEGGITVDGRFIPEGTVVGVPAYAIHRNPEYFPQPDTFYPERWMAVDASESESSPLPGVGRTLESISLARQAFVAFSQGSRGCIGRQLAYYELHTTLALLLHRFDVRLARDSISQEPIRVTTDWKGNTMNALDDEQGNSEKNARHETKSRGAEFQLFDRFLSDRNGPMVEFRERR